MARPPRRLLLLAFLLGACGGGDEPTVDAAPPIPCTLGDDTPCAALDPAAYCYEFGAGGGGGGATRTVCTRSCSTAGDCPSGWTCNNMGRCRPPD